MFFLYAFRVLKLVSGEDLKQLRKSLKIVFYSPFLKIQINILRMKGWVSLKRG